MNPITLTIRRAVRPRVAVSWSVNQLLAWLNEVEPIADQRGKFDWLEIPPIASSTAIQEAYHQIARTRHPDLFRSRIDVRTMDRLVRMYARDPFGAPPKSGAIGWCPNFVAMTASSRRPRSATPSMRSLRPNSLP